MPSLSPANQPQAVPASDKSKQPEAGTKAKSPARQDKKPRPLTEAELDQVAGGKALRNSPSTSSHCPPLRPLEF
jgi:hypothetical protein